MSQVGQVVGILRNLKEEYQISTPKKLKLIDAYLVYVLLTGIIQFAYCLLVGTFPFNSFLSGFISTVGCFILAGKYSIRI
jgi:oligosaccharyltransferase complex subunit epsilon